MNPDQLLAEMAASGSETWTQWNWRKIIEALAKEGYSIVKRPELTDKGVAGPRPW